MMHRTIDLKPLRLYTSYAPEEAFDLFVREHGADPATAIGKYLAVIARHPGMEPIRAAIIEDLRELRDEGALGPQLAVPDRYVGFIEAWNTFLDGGSSDEVTRTVTRAVEVLIENEAIRLFIPNKTCRGPVRPHHLETSIDLGTAARRLPAVEESLNGRLKTGSFGEKFFGLQSEHDGSGLIRIRLQGFRPIVERARDIRNVMTWHSVDVMEIEPDRDLEPEF